MKLQSNAKLWFIFLYGCAYFRQTCATYTVEEYPSSPEEQTDSPKIIEKLRTVATFPSAPEEDNLQTVGPEMVTTEKPEVYGIDQSSDRPETHKFHTDSPKIVTTEKSAVTVANNVDETTREEIWGSCTKYRLCRNGDCKIVQCSRTWKISVFDPISKRCVYPGLLPPIYKMLWECARPYGRSWTFGHSWDFN